VGEICRHPHCGSFLPSACIGEQEGKNVIRLSHQTPHLSFKAREVKFCIYTSQINAKKVTKEIFNILSGAEIWGVI